MTSSPRSILLATDGSEEAELAARVAVELAKSTGSELHLVRVKLPLLTPPYPDVLDWRWREDLERAEREARELLDEQVKKVEDAGGTVAGAHLREELPAEEIVALAEELGACLIVVGSRDRGRLRRALAGSVSDWVVRHAHCPVVVVRSHKGAGNRARLSRGRWTRSFRGLRGDCRPALRHLAKRWRAARLQACQIARADSNPTVIICLDLGPSPAVVPERLLNASSLLSAM